MRSKKQSKKIFYGLGKLYDSSENTPNKEPIDSPRSLRSVRQGSFLSPRELNLSDEEGQLDSPKRSIEIEFVDASCILDAESLVALSEDRYGSAMQFRPDHLPDHTKRARINEVAVPGPEPDPEPQEEILAFVDASRVVQNEIRLDLNYDELILDDELVDNRDEVEPGLHQAIPQSLAHASPAPLQQAAVAERLHLSVYENRDYPCAEFLTRPINTKKKTLFEILYKEGTRFLCADNRGHRYWGIYPSHEEIVIQGMLKPYNQFYLYRLPTDSRYYPTWVSAVVKDKNGEFWPLHIVSKSYLGSVKNMISYPRKIITQFPADKFLRQWPEGLGKQCLIITVDSDKQKRDLIAEFENFVLQLGHECDDLLPSFRIFCNGTLSEVIIARSYRQQSIVNFVEPQPEPNVYLYAKRRLEILKLENELLNNCVKGGLSQHDFNRACNLFIGPAILSNEVALAYFTLSQIIRYTGVRIESRKRLIDLRGKICAKYQGTAAFNDERVTTLLQMMDQSILVRTHSINKLNDLRIYLLRLCSIFGVDHNDAKMEYFVFNRLAAVMKSRGRENIELQDTFQSGSQLIVWMLKKNINLAVGQGDISRNITPAELVDQIEEHIRTENARILAH